MTLTRTTFLFFVGAALSCGQPLPKGAPTPTRFFDAARTDTRFVVADHMLASIEMQISGEPFAQLLGRNLTGFDRFNRQTDLYTDPSTNETRVDPLGYSTAVESYEYSKQPMNQLSFESGAGLALEFGPVLNPTNLADEPGFQLLLARMQHLAEASHSGGPMGRAFVVSPPPQNNPLNTLGWPGYFPVMAEFRSFHPEIQPSAGATRGCTLVGGYKAAAAGITVVGDYECGYNSLNLPLRDSSVEKVMDPAALGFALWKQALWVVNYWQTLHDLTGNGVTQVADADLPNVGVPGNIVVGRYPDPADPTGKKLLDGVAGVYLGDITLEGWQGLTMLDEMDNKAAFLLTRLMTADGTQLQGFPSTKAAIEYDYAAPARWWPEATAVTEVTLDPPAIGFAWKHFPQPTTFQIQTGSSRLRGLGAIAGGFAVAFALTDFNNAAVGGLVSSRATFDGDPFAADNQLPDGEESMHDRTLAMMKVAAVNMDRLHFDPKNQVMVDDAAVGGNPAARGTKVSSVDAAYAIVGLRTALRSMESTLTLYSNDTPDTHGLATRLDGAPLAGATAALPDRMLALIAAQADFIAGKLVAADGSVANFFDLSTGKGDAAPTTLEAECAAIRGLLDAFLATSNDRYRATAIRVYADLERRFWMNDVRAFRTVAGVSDKIVYTPLAVGTLSGALRQYWKLVAHRPGQERVAADLLERLKRTYKLVVNGWDDANGDDLIKYPDECTGGGMQMAERALTGELSHPADGQDRDHDCVLEISAVKLPASLAGQVTLTRKK